jgi:hypothetical protein
MDDPDGLAGHLDPPRFPDSRPAPPQAQVSTTVQAFVVPTLTRDRECDEFTVVFPVYLYVFSSYG